MALLEESLWSTYRRQKPAKSWTVTRELFEELCKLDTTDKQAMAMACMLLADEIAVKLFFTAEQPLQIVQVKQYLQSAFDVDIAERAYQQVLNWVAKYQIRFEDPKAENSLNKGEVWGKIGWREADREP